MRKLFLVLLTALFAMAMFSAYSADQSAQPATTAPAVQQSANPIDESGRGAPSTTTNTGAVQVGAPAAEGRADPTGAPAAGGGAVTSPTPTGPGRGDNQ